jgi:hypothetical protein
LIPATWTGWRNMGAGHASPNLIQRRRFQKNRVVDDIEESDIVEAVANANRTYGPRSTIGVD